METKTQEERQKIMKVLAEFTIVPLDVGISLSGHIAEVIKYLRSTDLTIEEHSMGTNLEGDWDQVMQTVKKCNEILLARGAKRVSTNLKLSLRVDKVESMNNKLKSVNDKIK